MEGVVVLAALLALELLVETLYHACRYVFGLNVDPEAVDE